MTDFLPESVAFVTGAGSGIGLAVSKRLVADGIKNIAVIDLTEDHLKPTVSSLSSLDPSAKVLQIGADCSQEDQVESAVAQTVEVFGRLDLCFNAAGISGSANKTAEMSSENLDAVLGLNLKGVWYCERAQIRQMLKQELRAVNTGLSFQTRGSIVNVGSLASHLAVNTLSPYIMAKHGVLGLTRGDALDYASQGIRVNCVSPGWIKTNINKVVWDGPRSDKVVARAPMARWGLPEEVAYTVSFLLSDKASFITGTSIHIDGGYTAC